MGQTNLSTKDTEMKIPIETNHEFMVRMRKNEKKLSKILKVMTYQERMIFNQWAYNRKVKAPDWCIKQMLEYLANEL